jgi:NADPH2:quinone reductase
MRELRPQLERIRVPQPQFIFCCNNTDRYFDKLAQMIAPEGKICSIVETHQPQDINVLMSKSATFRMGANVHPLDVRHT